MIRWIKNKNTRVDNADVSIRKNGNKIAARFSDEALAKIFGKSNAEYLRIGISRDRVCFAIAETPGLDAHRLQVNYANGKATGRRFIRFSPCNIMLGDFNPIQYDENEGLYFVSMKNKI